MKVINQWRFVYKIAMLQCNNIMEFSEKKSFAVIMDYSIYFFQKKNSKFTSTYDISDQGNY